MHGCIKKREFDITRTYKPKTTKTCLAAPNDTLLHVACREPETCAALGDIWSNIVQIGIIEQGNRIKITELPVRYRMNKHNVILFFTNKILFVI